MTILDRIVIDKIKEVALRKKIFPTSYWEQSPLFERAGSSLAQNLKNSSSGIIAEHKRRSPSRDNINSSLSVHCLLYTSPSPRDLSTSRMPSSA